ncbi:hypothetical protein AB0J21_08520 [Streptomyces sp. NPDC049954]|uniref:hypothetical protein n=1 Tax=Streptomyces sp. NPDC049954 TaxID=3155779 RepID=UPI003432AE03
MTRQEGEPVGLPRRPSGAGANAGSASGDKGRGAAGLARWAPSERRALALARLRALAQEGALDLAVFEVKGRYRH